MEIRCERRKTRVVQVGNVPVGGDNPIVVQSMITESTLDVEACVKSVTRLYASGCEIVRITTPNMNEAKSLAEIKKKLRQKNVQVPLVADVHHQGSNIAVEVAKFVDKVRINPGLFVFHKPELRSEEYSQAEVQAELDAIESQLLPVIKICKERDIAMRIGVNHGSLAERMLVTYGDTPEGMVQSAIEYIQICETHDFKNIIVSLKASRVPIMIQANRLMAKRMDDLGMSYPLHLGVTEAGDGGYGRIKSTAGIATLLSEGIGDTIRVSLAEDPIMEIPVCYEILQALGLRKTAVEYIACPSCGRTKFNLQKVLHEVRESTKHLVGLDIAVMGCIVNGPGEMADANYGYVGKAGGMIALYRKRECVKIIPQERGVEELIDLIKADGRWVEPGM